MIKMQMADDDQVKRGEIDVFLQLGKAPVPHIEQYPSAVRLDQKTGASAVRLRQVALFPYTVIRMRSLSFHIST